LVFQLDSRAQQSYNESEVKRKRVELIQPQVAKSFSKVSDSKAPVKGQNGFKPIS